MKFCIPNHLRIRNKGHKVDQIVGQEEVVVVVV
jgi:hypothetical protein